MNSFGQYKYISISNAMLKYGIIQDQQLFYFFSCKTQHQWFKSGLSYKSINITDSLIFNSNLMSIIIILSSDIIHQP